MPFPDSFYRWRPHPWHGLEVGSNAPKVVNAYIEITPFDHVKYEIDKKTGYLCVDRPNRTSAHPPALYGFIPRTYCGKRVAELMGKEGVRGDHDPLDICVLSERPIARADIVLKARILGGLPMIDGGEADDKIIAVLDTDYVHENANCISDLPEVMIERLHHYFTTYKLQPGKDIAVEIGEAYGREHAEKVIKASMEDYQERYADS